MECSPPIAETTPLRIAKDLSRASSAKSYHTRHSSSTSQNTTPSRSMLRLTSPATADQRDVPQPIFHPYLRAFYHFHQTPIISSITNESSVTVPINQGDVILVHTIHPNGWADGTLLASGARGWLPTNYCEPYGHEAIRPLLTALTNAWDMIRSSDTAQLSAVAKQDYTRGIIAGVRVLLEQSRCLNRDTPIVQGHEGIRRMRKGLLGDLASLVKAGKRLQCSHHDRLDLDDITELLDGLILKAFKVVTRAVRFLDIWMQDIDVQETASASATAAGASLTHSTKCVVLPNLTEANASCHSKALIKVNNDHPLKADTTGFAEPLKSFFHDDCTGPVSPSSRTLTTSRFVSSPSSCPGRRSPTSTAKRRSQSHRLSYKNSARRDDLASERLCAAHDAFLSFIGSFIGLHLQSRSSTELLAITQQSVDACQTLLKVIEAIWQRDHRRSSALFDARTSMYGRLTGLVQATREISKEPSFKDHEVLLPDQGRHLVATATACVRSAGECRSRARTVIERIGDFELQPIGPTITGTFFDGAGEDQPQAVTTQASPCHQEKPLPPTPPPSAASDGLFPPPLTLLKVKDLPEPPVLSPLIIPRVSLGTVVPHSLRPGPTETSDVYSTVNISDVPLPAEHQLHNNPSELNSPAEDRPFAKSDRAGSAGVSFTDTISTYVGSFRESEASMISDASTRANSPEPFPASHKPVFSTQGSFISLADSQSTWAEEAEAVEAQILEKTYAHELMFNKDGQISGGSLPALVERLTVHDSTPDARFVSTFYLTFRLFTTPPELAQTLIDRFDYVGDSKTIATPVRLRVYNVFKGWLESHWRSDCDAEALDLILNFASGKLRAALPTAGKRLIELLDKVSNVCGGLLVPSLVSSIGKTNTSIELYADADAPLPQSILSKSQLLALKNFRKGGSSCSILDFDPLELARQFTIIESKIFCAIRPEELLALEWTKNKTDSKAVNVRAMSTLATDLANLVADTILQFEDAKKRALVIKQWVKIAKRCLELHNYDSLMAILCSLNSSMVLRLKQTWSLISQKTATLLDELKAIVDCSRNYAVLRRHLSNNVAPCLPFVGIYLTDLTFVDVGNQGKRQLPNYNGTGESISVINFDKHMRTAKIIGDLQRFQIPYRLRPVSEMQDWMEMQIQRVRCSDQANVQSYYRRSLLLEPRETQAQIQRRKTGSTDASVADGGLAAGSATGTGGGGKEKFDFWSSFHISGSANSSKEKVGG